MEKKGSTGKEFVCQALVCAVPIHHTALGRRTLPGLEAFRRGSAMGNRFAPAWRYLRTGVNAIMSNEGTPATLASRWLPAGMFVGNWNGEHDDWLAPKSLSSSLGEFH